MLTKQQDKLFNFLKNYFSKKNIMPNFDEMKDALDLKSKSGIHRILNGLEERGYIKKLVNRARAIEIIKPNITRNKSHDEIVSLPLLGQIAAGAPIEAISDDTNYIDFPKSLIGNGEFFVLNVKGDSMIEAGILDGDKAIIKKSQTAENGDIIVALIDNEEVTLKRLIKRSGQVALQPENKAYETRIYGHNRVKIQGILSNIYRNY